MYHVSALVPIPSEQQLLSSEGTQEGQKGILCFKIFPSVSECQLYRNPLNFWGVC